MMTKIKKQKGEIGLMILAAIAIAIPSLGIFLLNKNSETTPDAAKVTEVSGMSLSKEDNFPVKIITDTGGKKISFASVKIQFDKDQLRVSAPVKTISQMSTIMKLSKPEQANASGQIEFTIAVPGGEIASAPQGVVTLAEINFDPLKNGSGEIKVISNGTQVVSIDNKLVTAVVLPATYLIK